MPQIQAYLHLFDVKVCILVGYHRPHNFFTWGDITDRQSYKLDFDESRLDVYYIPRDSQNWKSINKKASKFFKGLEALKENNLLTEKQFNTIVYGSQLVELLEKWQDQKQLEKLLIQEDIFQVQIGDVSIKRTDITDFAIDVPRLMQEMPEVFEEYKTITTTKKIEIRRKKNVAK
jgi:cell division protein FtsI/penicillin-binding protein 2